MAETMTDLIASLKKSGMTAIQVQKYLRDNGYAVSWLETRITYQKV